MEDALNRLTKAVEYAVAATATGSRDQRGKLIARIAAALTTQGTVNSVDSMAELPNFEALRLALPVVVKRQDGSKGLHPIWTSPCFLMPSIAALAIFFERNLCPHGDATLSAVVKPTNEGILGYQLTELTASGYRYDDAGKRHVQELTPEDWMRVSVLLSGAALAVMKEVSMLKFSVALLEHFASGQVADFVRQTPAQRPKAFIFSSLVVKS